LKRSDLVEQEKQLATFYADLAKTKLDNAEAWKLLRETVFMQKLTNAVNTLPKPAKLYKSKAKKKIEQRRVNLVLSDLHFGSDLTANTNLDSYGIIEESRRMARVVLETINYKPQYRDITTLNIHMLGDILQGKLHDPMDGDKMVNQFWRAFHIFTHAITLLAQSFPYVIIDTMTGNHGRNPARHHNRAVIDKTDSYEGMLYAALKVYFSKVPNVEINIYETPFYIRECFGQHGFYTHGDTVLNVGNPGKVVNTEAIAKHVNDINDGLAMHNLKSNLFCIGHVHTPVVMKLNNGIDVVINGALVPSDRFAKSIGIFSTACAQQVFESVPGYIMGDHRAIVVGSKDDADASLDKIIPPWNPSYSSK
jgi:hypothetical protein